MAETWSRSRRALVVALGVTLLALGADLAIPLGYATGAFHVVALLTVLWGRSGKALLIVLAATSVGLWLDVEIGESGPSMRVALVNRALTQGVLLAVAAVGYAFLREVRRSEEALKERDRLMRAALDGAPDAMLLVDDGGSIHYANTTACRLFGYDAAAFVGKPIELLVPLRFRDKHAKLMAAFLAAPARRPMAAGDQALGVTSDGREIPIEVSLSRLNSDHQLTIAAVRDASEKRTFEERLRATQRMEAVGKLAGGIAHDFNNTLAAIICSAELARETLPEGTVREDVDEVLRSAQRAAGLTRQLLAFSRRQIIAPKAVSINAAVSDMHTMLERLLGASVALELRLREELGVVVIDPSQLEQVLLNLCINARDAMPEGGTIVIETANVTLDDTYAAQHPDVTAGDYVMLAVSDTGEGMTPEVRVRVFEPFFSTKPVGSGTGLGLSTVYGIIKQANGHVWVYSEVGEGTTFKVYFPRSAEKAEPLRSPRPAPPLRGGTEVVLVVDDEPALRRLVVRTLRDVGYTVLEAANGQDALLKLSELTTPIDLLLTDVVMPQMGGLELAKRAIASQPNLPVLYMSGYTENAIVHHGVLDPSVVFIQKPFKPEELRARIRQLLDAARTEEPQPGR